MAEDLLSGQSALATTAFLMWNGEKHFEIFREFLVANWPLLSAWIICQEFRCMFIPFLSGLSVFFNVAFLLHFIVLFLV
jgi:hypothetical protein